MPTISSDPHVSSLSTKSVPLIAIYVRQAVLIRDKLQEAGLLLRDNLHETF